MSKVLIIVLFLVFSMTGFFVPGYLNASSHEDLQNEAVSEEELLPEEQFEQLDNPEAWQDGLPEEEHLSPDEEQYLPDAEEEYQPSEEEQNMPDPEENRS